MMRNRIAAREIAQQCVSPKATEPLILIIGYRTTTSLSPPHVCRGAQLHGIATIYRYVCIYTRTCPIPFLFPFNSIHLGIEKVAVSIPACTVSAKVFDIIPETVRSHQCYKSGGGRRHIVNGRLRIITHVESNRDLYGKLLQTLLQIIGIHITKRDTQVYETVRLYRTCHVISYYYYIALYRRNTYVHIMYVVIFRCDIPHKSTRIFFEIRLLFADNL